MLYSNFNYNTWTRPILQSRELHIESLYTTILAQLWYFGFKIFLYKLQFFGQLRYFYIYSVKGGNSVSPVA